jgi:phage-related protein
MPQSRPMPSIGPRRHELRIRDRENNWRIIYRTDKDAIIILEVFSKKTGQTPAKIVGLCRARLRHYDSIS